MEEETETPFQRCHFEPAAFTHFLSPRPVIDEPGRVVYDPADAVPERILCLLYVDDGQVWDNSTAACDGFSSSVCVVGSPSPSLAVECHI